MISPEGIVIYTAVVVVDVASIAHDARIADDIGSRRAPPAGTCNIPTVVVDVAIIVHIARIVAESGTRRAIFFYFSWHKTYSAEFQFTVLLLV